MTSEEAKEFFEKHGDKLTDFRDYVSDEIKYISINVMYKAFKARLLDEIVAVEEAQNTSEVISIKELPLKVKEHQDE